MQNLVLGASFYDFVDEKTGERRAGVTITYVDQPEVNVQKKGFIPMSISADVELWEQLQVCPGIYDFDFGMKATKVGGKPVVVLKSLKFVKEAKLPIPVSA